MGGIPYLETIHFLGSMLNLGSGNGLGLVVSLPSDASDATSDHPDYFAFFGFVRICICVNKTLICHDCILGIPSHKIMCPTDLSS